MSGFLSVKRTEAKYVMDDREQYRLKRYFSQVLRQDQHNGVNGYLVRSLYFDTITDSDYFDKIEGLNERHKLRLRIYDPQSNTVKLELKEKTGAYQRKRSMLISRSDAELLINGDLTPLQQSELPFAREILNLMICNVYRPKCIVQYDRFAYTYPINDIRITFDDNVRSSNNIHGLFNEKLCMYPAMPLGHKVMEVKYNNFLPSFVRNVVSNCGFPQSASSKYCLARNVGR